MTEGRRMLYQIGIYLFVADSNHAIGLPEGQATGLGPGMMRFLL
jgi:hypothetical protein